jgi:hypothetical protein
MLLIRVGRTIAFQSSAHSQRTQAGQTQAGQTTQYDGLPHKWVAVW